MRWSYIDSGFTPIMHGWSCLQICISCCFLYVCVQHPFWRLRHFFTSHEKCVSVGYFVNRRTVACNIDYSPTFCFLECIANVYNVNFASAYYEKCVQTYLGYHIPYHQWISYDLNTASGHGDRSSLIDPRNNVTLCRRTVRANRTATDVGHLLWISDPVRPCFSAITS